MIKLPDLPVSSHWCSICHKLHPLHVVHFWKILSRWFMFMWPFFCYICFSRNMTPAWGGFTMFAGNKDMKKHEKVHIHHYTTILALIKSRNRYFCILPLCFIIIPQKLLQLFLSNRWSSWSLVSTLLLQCICFFGLKIPRKSNCLYQPIT